MPFPPSSVIVRREVRDHAGPFDVELNRNTAPHDDLDAVTSVARIGEAVTYPEFLDCERLRGSAISLAVFTET